MALSASSEELLRGARAAAAARNVREAIRDLALHALRGRPLTAAHIAAVARTVGEGIESCDIPPTAPVRETSRGAWEGLEEAVGQALRAVELAAREAAEGRAWLPAGEGERMSAEIDRMERTLREGWQHPRVVPASLKRQITTVSALLQRAEALSGQGCAQAESRGDPGAILAYLASGVLLGLAEDVRVSSNGASR